VKLTKKQIFYTLWKTTGCTEEVWSISSWDLMDGFAANVDIRGRGDSKKDLLVRFTSGIFGNDPSHH
jgi:hypothetical protein